MVLRRRAGNPFLTTRGLRHLEIGSTRGADRFRTVRCGPASCLCAAAGSSGTCCRGRPGASPLTVAPADAGGARRFVARTPRGTAFPCLPLVDDGFPRRAHQRDQLRLAQSARRSPWARWPKSMAHDDHPAEPVGHSRRGETAWRPRALPALGGGERWSGCHRSPAAARPARRCCTNRHWPARGPPTGSSPADAV